jgi:type VI secretion system protein VasD
MMGSSNRGFVARAWGKREGARANLFRGALLVGLASCTTGCPAPPAAAPEPCDKQVVTLDLYAADNINPNETARPRPVVVRLYQLQNDVRMLNAQYDDILLRDKETLATDLMKMDEVEVFPNDLVQVKFERIPEASVLCGAAMFHQPRGQSWKTFYEFPPMPNAPSCGAAEEDAGEPQPNPRTAFFVVESKIDNGSQYDESMFPNATAIRRVALPKRSAASDQYSSGGATPAAAGGKGK